MALFENFPYTNLHELNLDWIIERIKKMEDQSVLSVNGETGYVILYQNAKVEFPEVTEDQWSIVRTADGTECGILFDTDGTAYIFKGNGINPDYYKIYTQKDQPPYPVTSVNGMTGDIQLFTEQYIHLPNLTDEEMTQWNIYRRINNITSGIQFADDGKAYIMIGNNRYQIYTQNDQPPYPVSSVNGQTGAVTLYPDADVILPTVNDNTWTITRIINGTSVGLVFDDTGCSLAINDDEYPLYIQGLNEPSDFDDPTAVILELTENLSTGTQWGIIRSLQNNDEVGIVFKYDSDNSVYEGFLKVNNTLTKLLTLDDIPSTSGVVSINGLTGIVYLYGTNIYMEYGSSYTVKDVIDNLKNDLAIIENTNTATHNISVGHFVVWNNALYIATTSISVGDALSSANLQAVTNGGLNDLQDHLFVYPGDSFSDSTAEIVSAIITSNLEVIYLSIPISKNMAFVTNASISQLVAGFRVPEGGYLNGNNYNYLANADNISTVLDKNAGMIRLQLTKTGGWSNAIANNTPLIGTINYTFTFS